MNYAFALLSVSLSATTTSSTANDGPSALSLGQIVRIAMDENPGVSAEIVAHEALEAERRSAAGHFGPVVRAEVNAMLWNSDNVYAFDVSGFQTLFDGFGMPGLTVPPMEVTVRDQLTAKFTVMVVQPLSQLYQIAYGHQARKALAEAGKVEVTTKRRDLQLQVARTYLGALGAEEMRQSILQSETQLEAMELQTRRYLEQGLLSKDALLKVQVQREDLARNRFAVEKSIRLTHATLNMLMGRPLATPLRLAPLSEADEAGVSHASLTALQAQALDARPELVSARSKVKAAEAAHEAAFGKLFPDVNLVGAYNHNEGMGDLMLRNEAFVGLTLNWNAWEWGSTAAEVEAAKLKAKEAALRVQAAEEGLQLEVAQRFFELEEAQKQQAVAQASLALAQENLRLEQNYYEARQSTATDLLNAQTAALRARNDRTVAMIQVALARRALAIASGEDLIDLTSHKETP